MIRKFLIALLTLGALLVALMWIGTFLTLAFSKDQRKQILGNRPHDYFVFVSAYSIELMHHTCALCEKKVQNGIARPCLSSNNSCFNCETSFKLPRPSLKISKISLGPLAYNHYLDSIDESFSLTIQWWAIVVLLAFYPTAAFYRGPFRTWRRKHKGRCLKCGYDLRESSERCPECGKTIKDK